MKIKLFFLILILNIGFSYLYAKSSNEKLIVGRWQLIQIKVDKEIVSNADQKIFFVFTADGKMSVVEGNEKSEQALSYNIKENEVKTVDPIGNKKESFTIIKLTETELIIQTNSEGSVATFNMERVK